MAAYAALVSVMQTIHQIEHHPSPPISMDKKQVESLTEIVMFLQEFLEGYKSPYADSDEADPLEMRIADAVYAAEDVIESHIVDQIIPARKNPIGLLLNCFRGPTESKKYGPQIIDAEFFENLQKVIEEMDLIKKQVIEIDAVKDQMQKQDFAVAWNNSSAPSLSMLNNTTMTGFDDVMLQLMDKLTDGRLGRHVIPIVGMGGIGKTTLAVNVYAKPFITRHFDICAWVTISQQFQTKELLCEILSQATKQGKAELSQMREDEIGLSLHKYLSYRRYLIVLDDMWSIEAWEKLQCYFPDNSNGSRIMVTTRLSKLGSQLDNSYGIEMKFMDEESSWNMLCKIVFGGESCPLELHEIAKKIVEGCRGLPLSIVVMGGLLRKKKRTKECWKSISRSISLLVNSENDKHCLKILKLSYSHLPVYLKPCFLYLGIFEEDSEIRVSTVIKLWVSEGFLKPISSKSLETVAKEYLDELVDRNLILVHRFGKTGKMRYLKIHDLLRDLCLREAQKEGFYHVVGQHSPQGRRSQYRVVILRSTSKREVLDAIRSTPHARSYTSDHARVRSLPNLRLLRTLRARNGDVCPRGKLLKLFNLRLLFVYSICNSTKLPPINLLWSLQTLTIGYDQNPNAPVDIWDMPQLRHVHFWRPIRLRDPPSDSIIIMHNLQTLKGVIDFNFDETMARRIPNIRKLEPIYFNESRDGDFCVHNIEHLQKLESLNLQCSRVVDFSRKVTFPYSLTSLALRCIINGGIGYMLEKVGTLPLLQKLTLDDVKFPKRKWETVEGQFLSLKYLSMFNCYNLVLWIIESSHFPCLEHLDIGSKNLKEIPAEVGEIPTLKYVTLSQVALNQR
ncbi:putative late blight resistance protein homolog R1B-14 [Salvia hispanica]|uniref:putative late blight resistance protein homolog R1B-14 n=1 Tax=Salvia hispanica TaxID=49212 RepID=UPI0020093C84|nr:putative late blight resistance protein homolog R1B-14 [Salvia hispanica]